MLNISQHCDLAAVDSIRDVWRELWWKTPQASFFQSVEWFEHRCRAAADVQQPRVFLVAAAGRPVGLVPWVEKSVLGCLGRRRVLSDPLVSQGFSCGALGSRPDVILKAVVDHARAERRWHRFEIRHTELDSAIGHDAVDQLQSPRMRDVAEDARVVVACRGDWVRYLRSRPLDVREQYQSAERILAAKGPLEYLRYRPEGTPLLDDDPRWELFRELEGMPDAAGTEREGLLREVHEAAATVAGVDLNLLRLDGRPIAWAYNYRCDGRIEMQSLGTAGPYSSAAASVLLGACCTTDFAAAMNRTSSIAKRAAPPQDGKRDSRRAAPPPLFGASQQTQTARRFFESAWLKTQWGIKAQTRATGRTLSSFRASWFSSRCLLPVLPRLLRTFPLGFVEVLPGEVRGRFAGKPQKACLQHDFADDLIAIPGHFD